MRLLLAFTILVSVACRGNSVDPGELRVAVKRIAHLERLVDQLEVERLRDACQVADLLMRENAMQRMDLAGKMAKVKQLGQLLAVVNTSRRVKQAHHRTAGDIGARLIANVKGGAAPAFLFILDRSGRVVARVGREADRYGDVLSAPAAISETLHGYMRDDVWIIDEKLYRIATSPVVHRELKGGYAGAIIVGHRMDKTLASDIAKRLRVNIGFYRLGGVFVQTARVPGVEKTIRAAVAKLSDKRNEHCLVKPTVARDGGDAYHVLTARLPGHAGAQGASYAVFGPRNRRTGKE